MAIGRLPAATLEQAQMLVAKLIAWEDSGQGLAGAATLVADNPDLAGDFEADVEDIRASFLASRETRVLKLSELGAQTRPAILDALNSGLSFLSYVGHGGAAVWASENVWNSWDAASLQAQSRQPFLLTMNCLNGYFVAPAFDSLVGVAAQGRGPGCDRGLLAERPEPRRPGAPVPPRADGRAHGRPARAARRRRPRGAEGLRADGPDARAAGRLPPARRSGDEDPVGQAQAAPRSWGGEPRCGRTCPVRWP